METFEVKILQMRKRLGVKEISAPSIEIAESYLTQLLKQYLNLEDVSEKIIYLKRSHYIRKLKLQIYDFNFSISLIKSYLKT